MGPRTPIYSMKQPRLSKVVWLAKVTQPEKDKVRAQTRICLVSKPTRPHIPSTVLSRMHVTWRLLFAVQQREHRPLVSNGLTWLKGWLDTNQQSCLGVNFLASLSLSFFICQMGMTALTSSVYCEVLARHRVTFSEHSTKVAWEVRLMVPVSYELSPPPPTPRFALSPLLPPVIVQPECMALGISFCSLYLEPGLTCVSLQIFLDF